MDNDLVTEVPLNQLGAPTFVSSVQSNHTRQGAAATARTGLKCVPVQESWVEWPDVVYDRVDNILLCG
jgi:1-aminocyclopropane-1-carboxylate deaminase